MKQRIHRRAAVGLVQVVKGTEEKCFQYLLLAR